MSVAAVDVHYEGAEARAAAVFFRDFAACEPERTCVRSVGVAAPYEPGNFYRRELPPLLALLAACTPLPDVVIVDGYVWLDGVSVPGLGARLKEAVHREFGAQITVVGVAKRRFPLLRDAQRHALCRGESRRPLFVTSAGVPFETARRWIAAMCGEHRLPKMLALVDRLARGRNGF